MPTVDNLLPVPAEIPPGELPQPTLAPPPDAVCDGNCIYGYDILSVSDGVSPSALNQVAYADPACSLHGPPLDYPECDR